jgi:hypothetical protein
MSDDALTSLAKTFENVSDLLRELAGPLFKEVGLTLGDKAREYRIKNAITILARVKQMLSAGGVSPNTIPARLFLPMFESASLEDDDILQEKWAALIANTSLSTSQVRPAFIETLKELTPEGATLLDRIYDCFRYPPAPTFPGQKLETLEELEAVIFGKDHYRHLSDEQKEYLIILNDDLTRLGIFSREQRNIITVNDAPGSSLPIFDFYLTPFGYAFIAACRAPKLHRKSTEPE